MWFKKSSIQKKPPYLINMISALWVLAILIFWLTFLKNFNFTELNIQKETHSWSLETDDIEEINKIKEEEKEEKEKNTTSDEEKESIKDYIITGKSDRTNILVVGRWWEGHDAPNITDTIILMSINTKKEIISMLSIPRDLYVEYNNGNLGRINAIYEVNKIRNDSKEIGMVAIADKVSQITWEKIDFFINVDFNGFRKVIDVIGGIELTIEDQFTDYAYPDGKWWYTTIVFREWTWLFDGENTLKYARSRHSTSDFDRSLRQQQIISSIRKKLSASYFIKSPSKIKKLYDTFNEYVYTNLKLGDILKLAIKVKSSDYTVQSFNLNDSCFYGSASCTKWWFLYLPNREYFWWAAVLLVEWTDKNNLNAYSKLHEYTNIIFDHPWFSKENAKVNVYNSLPVNFLASILADEMIKYGFYIPKENSIWNTKKTYEKSVIYYNNISPGSETIRILTQFFPKAYFKRTPGPKYSKELDTKVEIIIWKDYKEVMKWYIKQSTRTMRETPKSTTATGETITSTGSTIIE